ncbi:TPR-like protein [Sistotremastrum suecicum HHB10207 ss-3]|uniref:TPR-like protein n=1 Tax=Sistotremastrum suecicum HHB10207 ss-3 TaxID=1314776 RepID=A0A166GMS4_9AGAM|nr:TPR-like protein [Sistotremastrum suecicum HHB10207 ss-3]
MSGIKRSDIESALLGLKAIAEVSSSPYAKIIASLTLLIHENKDITSFGDRVLETAWVISSAVQEVAETASEEMVRNVGQLLTALEGILDRLRKRTKRGKLSKFFSASSDDAFLKSCEDDWDKCLSLFLFHSKLRNLDRLSRFADSAEKFADELGDTLSNAFREQEELASSIVVHASSRSENDGSPLPEPPQIFFGRTAYLETVVSQLCEDEQVNIAILGAGGMGKTSVALAALHNQSVVSQYGKCRIFVSCEAIPDAKALTTAIGQSLGLTGELSLADIKRTLLDSGRRTLICLDNLETPWETASCRTEVENVLAGLSGIQTVSLLITMRGAERPANVLWKRPFLPPIPTLDYESTKLTFMAISDTSEADEGIDALLEVTDRIPLAVTLMANLAQYTPCSELLARWNDEKTAMLTRGYEDRLSSVDVSIQVTLSSERFRSSSRACLLLQILSHLPDGAAPSSLPSMVSDDEGVLAAVSTLRQVSLAYEDVSGHLRVLCPVREYVLKHLRLTSDEIRPLRAYYYKFAEGLSSYERTAQTTLEDLVAMRLEVANMASVLLDALQGPHPQAGAIQALLRVGDAAWIPGFAPGLFSLALAASRELKDRKLEADCLVHQYIFNISGNNLEDLKSLRMAENIYLERNDPEDAESLAQCLMCMGISYRRMEDQQTSIDLTLQAISLYEKRNNHVKLVECRRALASTYSASGREAEAMDEITLVVDMAEKHGLRTAALWSLKQLAAIQHNRGLIPLSLSSFKRASELEFEIFGESRQYDYSLFGIGTNYLSQSRLTDAYDFLHKAYRLSVKWRKPEWIAMYTMHLGMVSSKRDDWEDALTQLYLALRRFNELGHTGNAARCILEIAHVEMGRGNTTTAVTHIQQARVHVRRQKDISPDVEAGSLYQLGRIALQRQSYPSAYSFLIVATLLNRKIPERCAFAECILALGDVLLAEEDADSAKSFYLTTLELIRYLGLRRHWANCMSGLGKVASLQGDTKTAHCYFRDALDMYIKAEDKAGQAEIVRLLSSAQRL